jgi:hypothetical protein
VNSARWSSPDGVGLDPWGAERARWSSESGYELQGDFWIAPPFVSVEPQDLAIAV